MSQVSWLLSAIYLLGLIVVPVIIGRVDDNAAPGFILWGTFLWPLGAPFILIFALYQLGVRWGKKP
jgi:hypothetical protein